MQRVIEPYRDTEHQFAQHRGHSFFLNECKFAKNTDSIEFLVEEGCDIHCKDESGYNGLHLAVMSGKYQFAQYLIASSLSIEAIHEASGKSALYLAAEKGHEKLVLWLLEWGANITLQTKLGETLLHAICLGGNENLLKLFLSIDAINPCHVTNNGDTILHYVVSGGHEHLVHHLVALGLSINQPNKSNKIALHVAAEKGHSYLVRLLIQQGADIDMKTVNGWTALHYASRYGHEDIVRYLLFCGSNVESKDRHGWTAWHYAAAHNHKRILDILSPSSNTQPASYTTNPLLSTSSIVSTYTASAPIDPADGVESVCATATAVIAETDDFYAYY